MNKPINKAQANNIFVCALSKNVSDAAKRFAEQHQLTYRELLHSNLTIPSHQIALIFRETRIELGRPNPKNSKNLFIDFSEKIREKRFATVRIHKEHLARACGVKKDSPLRVFDATAGLGNDGFLLALLGCRVTLCEKNPIIAAMLKDAVEKARKYFPEIMARIDIQEENSQSFLERLNQSTYPDVIYLDPMYPQNNKTALAKKDMRILRAVVGDDTNASDVFTTALAKASQRVVVKRHRLAPPINHEKPHYQLIGKSCRFDIYLPKR